MTEYTYEEKQHARKVLGFRDTAGGVICLKDLSREALIDKITQMQLRAGDISVANAASRNALLKRLQAFRRAKALANKRADASEKAMRQLLDSLKEVLDD